MKNQTGMILLILLCIGLGVGLIWSQQKASRQKTADFERIDTFSNQLFNTSANLDQARKVNAELETDRTRQREAYSDLSNNFAQVSADLEKTDASLKTTQQQVAERDSKISDLESQNQELDQRALELSTSLTNLTVQIDDTQKRLAASEGDKAFLEKELQRLLAEKADLEKQFNDLTVLRAQVSRLKEELNVSRRLEWIRKGLFASSEQKGAEKLMQKNSAEQPKPPAYDLNVEISSDGSVRVVPPATNSAAATNAAPAQ